MKNIKYILPISLLLVGGLTGCGSTSSSLNGTDAIIHNNLDELKKGFTMTGEVHQNRAQITSYNQYTGDYSIDENTRETNDYNVEYEFDSHDLEAVHRYSWAYYEDEKQTLEDISYFEDEDGFIYSSSLNYKNQIDKKYFTSSYGDKVPFAAYGLINSFKLFDYSDITYNEDQEWYDLNIDKTSILCNNFFYSLNSGFFGVPQYAYITADENGVFNTLYIEMKPHIASDTDTTGTTTYLYEYNNEVEVKLTKLAETTISTVEPLEENKNNAPLKTALSKFGNNYTMTLTDESTNVSGTKTTNYRKYSFDGTNILTHVWGDTDGGSESERNSKDFLLKPDAESNFLYSYTLDETSGTWTKKNATYFLSLYQGKYLYSDVLPIISEVSSDLFTYDSSKDEYVNISDSGILSSLRSNCFVLTEPGFINTNANNAFQIGIRVDENNNIEYIKFKFSYTSATTALYNSGTVTLTFSDIGTTSIEA